MNCSINSLGNNCYCSSPTGEVDNLDSLVIALKDLKIVNSKLIELEYQKQINNKLKEVVRNDSIIIRNNININKQLDKDIKKITIQRNVCFGITIFSVCLTTLLLLK